MQCALAILGKLHDWQPLVGSILAILAAIGASYVAWHNVNRTLRGNADLEKERRKTQTKDVASIIHAELAHLVARCCFDSEKPWMAYWPKDATGSMKVINLKKFTPVEPVVYRATIGQLALIGASSSQKLIEFHYRLSSLRREIENIAGHTDEADPRALRLIALRFRQTLAPGLAALEALQPMIPDWEEAERLAFESYYEALEKKASGTLRSHLKKLIAWKQAERVDE